MSTLALKLVLTPALIGAASLVGRRWGPAVSGWLVGLPFTSGPVSLFVAVEQGAAFAASAAVGSLLGTAAQAAFCVGYAAARGRGGWPGALAAGTVAFAVAGLALERLHPSATVAAGLAVAALLLALWAMPRPAAAAVGPVPRPRWDLPARMTLATAIVLALTAAAPWVGPRFTGLLATFPVYAIILAVFAEVLEGRPAGLGVLRGLLVGLFSFTGFFLVVALGLVRAGLFATFAAAVVVALVLQAVTLRAIRPRA